MIIKALYINEQADHNIGRQDSKTKSGNISHNHIEVFVMKDIYLRNRTENTDFNEFEYVIKFSDSDW